MNVLNSWIDANETAFFFFASLVGAVMMVTLVTGDQARFYAVIVS